MIDDSYGPLIESLPLTFTDKVTNEFTRETKKRKDIITRSLDFCIGYKSDDPLRIHSKFNTVEAPTDEKGDIYNLEVENGATTSRSAGVVHRERHDCGYRHPALEMPPQIVWMAKDCLGLSDEEIAVLKERGINASTAGAEMDEMGNVCVLEAPPDGESRA